MPSNNSRTKAHGEDDNLSLRELAAPLFRRRKLLALALAAVFAVLSTAGVLLFYKFRSQMAVLVNRERIDSLVSTGVPNQTITEPVAVAEEEINSEAELLLSQDILEKVVIANHLQDQTSWLSSILPARDESYRVARAVKTLARQIKVRPSTKANIIDVAYSSSDPKLSFAVLNSLAGFYLEKHARVHRPQGSFEFFSAETERYKKALEESEARLRSFARSSGGAAPDVERADLDQQLAASIGQQHTTEQAIAADRTRIESDREQMQAIPPRATTALASAPPDLLLQQLGAQVLAAQTRRTQLALKYDASYPLMKEADQEVAEAQAAYANAEKTRYVTETTNADPTWEMVREDLARTQADLAGQRAALAANQASVLSLKAEMASLAEKGLDLTDLARDQKANEDNYLLYMAKREQARTSDALDKTKIENVAIAIPPAIPVLPVVSFPMIFVLAFAAAALLSVLGAYAFDYFDSSFHTPAEVADTLGIPVVVAMPRRIA